MMKTRHDNDMIDCTCVNYAENVIEQSWLIRQGVVYDEN